MFSPGVIAALIPIFGILAGMVAIWANHQQKMRKLELEAQARTGATSAYSASDISIELQQAIKGEFERLREDNAALHQRLTQLEKHLYASSNTTSQQEELAKQQRMSQSQ